MSAKKQLRRRSSEDEPRFVIGMDAHSEKLAISIWDWSDRFNPCLHQGIKCMDIESMVTTYERHVDLDSITIIEASTNSANLKRILNEVGYRAEVVRSDTIANKERKRRVCDIVDAENLALAYIKGDIDETKIEGFAKEQLEMLLEDYDRLFEREDGFAKKIAEIVLVNPRMRFCFVEIQARYMSLVRHCGAQFLNKIKLHPCSDVRGTRAGFMVKSPVVRRGRRLAAGHEVQSG